MAKAPSAKAYLCHSSADIWAWFTKVFEQCNNVQTSTGIMKKGRPKKMLCMMHSLHEINKQTKWGHNKALWDPIFKPQMLVASKNRAFNETRWQEMERGQFVLLIHQGFGSFCGLTQEGERGWVQFNKLSGALFYSLLKKKKKELRTLKVPQKVFFLRIPYLCWPRTSETLKVCW